jgi:hypothetical protein
MANRYSGAVSGTSYLRKPFDALLKVGMLKDQAYGQSIEDIQGGIDKSANYNTIYNPDTQYKIQKANELLTGINEIATQDISDPRVQNKLRSQINQFSNDPKVLGAIQRTDAYNTYLDRKKELGDKYRDQNADQFLADIEAFQMGDEAAGERLKLAPDIEGYYDYNKELQENLKNIQDQGISIIGGNYINNIEGRFGMNNGEIVSDDRLGKLFLNGLSAEAYQQMDKDYKYEKRHNQTQVPFEDWVANRAKSFQETYSNSKQKYDYTSAQLQKDKFNYVKQKDVESIQQGIPLNVPGVAQELTQNNFKELLYKKYGINLGGNDQVKSTLAAFGVTSTSGTGEVDTSKRNIMIADISDKIIKSFNIGTQLGQSQQDAILRQAGLRIQNGKLIGSPDNIENFYIEAFKNSNTNALDAYTLAPIFDTENTGKQLIALAQSGRAQLGINGSSPSDANRALQMLINDINSDKGVATVINPTSIYGKPTIEVVVKGTKGENGETIPGRTYNIGLDQNTQQYFTGVTNLTNSLLQGETDVDIKVDEKVNPNDPNEKYDLVGVNTRQYDQNGKPYIGTTLYLKDPKTGEKSPYQYDYKTWMQFEKIPEYGNSKFNDAFKKQVPVRPYQSLLNLN